MLNTLYVGFSRWGCRRSCPALPDATRCPWYIHIYIYIYTLSLRCGSLLFGVSSADGRWVPIV